jgi:hypothetical protein
MTTRELLNLGVSRGIITPDQRAALQTLLGAVESTEGAREAERGFNGVAIAYLIGAIVVLFAFGWFMVDRWKVLGPGGVLALAVTYAAIFLIVAQVLQREGFAFARGVATLLAVGMAPITMWALLQWTGLWTPELDSLCAAREHPFAVCQGQPMAIEFAVVAAALVAMRQMAFSPFMIPIAVVCVTLPERVLRDMMPGDVAFGGRVLGWRWVIVASVLAAAAYLIDRRRRDEDYGFWLWISVAVATLVAGLGLFSVDRDLRPALGPVSVLVIIGSVYVRRRIMLFVGMGGLVGFLGWLANDVFRVTVAFPLVLAVLGVSIIILTVWLQQKFPAVVRRMGGDPTKPPHFPGGVLSLLAPAALGLLLMGDAARLDREQQSDHRSRARAHARQERAKRDSIAAARLPKPQPAPARTKE